MARLRIDRLHPAHLGSERLDVAIVIDVLRATTTAVELIGRGLPRLLILKNPWEIERLPTGDGERFLVFSELDLPGIAHDKVDNSPALASRVDLAGRTPVLVSTNGTKAVGAALSCARTVLLATFSNVHAAARRARASARERITVLPTGDFEAAGEHIEDELCAKALMTLLGGESYELQAAISACFEDERVRRRIASKTGFLEDAERALRVTQQGRVPQARLIEVPGCGLIEVRPAPQV